MNETKFFAAQTDAGIEVFAAAAANERSLSGNYIEVPNIAKHLSQYGIQELLDGGTMTFTRKDPRYPQLLSLFA